MFASFTKMFHNKIYPSVSLTRPEIAATRKIVLITGAGSDIGQATVIAFAHAGAKAIILCGRRAGHLEDTREKIKNVNNRAKVLTIKLDVTIEASVISAFEGVKQEVGELDIVINAAGYRADVGKAKDTTVDNFWKGPLRAPRTSMSN